MFERSCYISVAEGDSSVIRPGRRHDQQGEMPDRHEDRRRKRDRDRFPAGKRNVIGTRAGSDRFRNRHQVDWPASSLRAFPLPSSGLRIPVTLPSRSSRFEFNGSEGKRHREVPVTLPSQRVECTLTRIPVAFKKNGVLLIWGMTIGHHKGTEDG